VLVLAVLWVVLIARAQMIDELEDIDADIGSVIDRFQSSSGRSLIHAVEFY
jgi:hypothetical protein